MSFSFTVSGHAAGPHNSVIREIAERAVHDIRNLLPGPSSVELFGHSYDSNGQVVLGTPDPATGPQTAGEPVPGAEDAPPVSEPAASTPPVQTGPQDVAAGQEPSVHVPEGGPPAPE